MTIQNIFNTINQETNKSGNIQLLTDIQNGKLSNVEAALDKLTAPVDIKTLFMHGFENGKTLLHAAFSSKKDNDNKMKEYLLKKVGNNLKEVLTVTNNAKKAPLEMILSGRNDDFAKLEAIINSCQDDEQKKAILQYQSKFNKKTFLHAAATKNKIEQDFFKNVFAKAKELKILEEVLTAKDNKNDTVAHKAIATKKEDVKNAFFKDLLALENNELVSVFKAQGENNKSLFLTAVLDKDTELINQLFNKLKAFSPEEIKNILVLKNSANKMTIKEFFKLADFESKFKDLGSVSKQAFADIIIEQIVGKGRIGRDNIDVNKLAPVFEANQAEFLKKVDLEEAAENLSKKFPDVAITAKLAAEAQSLADDIQGDKVATLKTALEKIEEYSTKFTGKTPENFGNSVKEAVTTKLNNVENAQREFSADNVEGLATALTNAKLAIDAYSEVYTQLDNKNVTLDNANSALNEAVKAKAQELVNAQCLDFATLENAQTCKALVESFKNYETLMDVVGQDFANGKLQLAKKTIDDKTVKPDAILKGTDLALYLAQHIKSKALAEGFKNNKESITDDNIAAAQKIFNVKSGLEKLEAVPGQQSDGDYATVFEADSAALMNEEGDEDYKGTNFDDEIVKIDANIVTLRTNACNEFKIQSECNDEAILQAVKSNFCPAKANLEDTDYSGTNAAKAFCAESINAWDGVLNQFTDLNMTFDA